MERARARPREGARASDGARAPPDGCGGERGRAGGSGRAGASRRDAGEAAGTGGERSGGGRAVAAGRGDPPGRRGVVVSWRVARQEERGSCGARDRCVRHPAGSSDRARDGYVYLFFFSAKTEPGRSPLLDPLLAPPVIRGIHLGDSFWK